ncbi:MAG: hypothetical protein A3E36_01585 [Candidatus Andersenbacteria bacterium RIFCSPHIGHO2_12_FULL_45_11b]|uniref:Uncharacterized protein n=1 Tax=Candidatus Andersenbacteria bacterium RIFCSPHIGHO2_12_FULL_45_11b TaxID=1797282 RepID=A0A1G1XB01_9BACT|nr:MAG: hypothetical protein A3E36_01585 [Candidatus Andersenbacteria bacterium RIFCSPHIGHO2_12_FULL_45_11b]
MADSSVTNFADSSVASSKKRTTRQHLVPWIRSHLRRMPLEFLNILFNHDLLFWLIGIANKRVGFLESVFLVYPASEKYARAYVYPFRLRRVMWNPWPCGLLWQNGKLTVMFCISATDSQFTDFCNAQNIVHVANRMERIRALLQAHGKTFAGILPGVLYAKRIIREAPEADLTAHAVVQAIEKIARAENLAANTPIVVLGGRGFIGRRIMRMLAESDACSVDSADANGHASWPDDLTGKPVIVVNVTVNHALADYLECMAPGTVVINEVYPEPTPDTLQRLWRQSCVCYHVVGIHAHALPPFPEAYRGAIPCCAAWAADDINVVVRKLV